MAGEMLALANQGVAGLRLDAVALSVKGERHTVARICPQAHTIIRRFQCVARLACPCACVQIRSDCTPRSDCPVHSTCANASYRNNPLTQWPSSVEAAATKEVRLLAYSIKKRHNLPEGCAWVNYTVATTISAGHSRMKMRQRSASRASITASS